MSWRQMKCKHCLSLSLIVCTIVLTAYFSLNKDGRKFFSAQMSRIEQESIDLAALLSTTSSSLRELKEENENLQNRIKEMQDLIHAKAHLFGDLKLKHTETEKLLQISQEKVTDLETTIDKLRHQLSMKDSQIKSLNEKKREVYHDLEQSQEQNVNLEKENARIKSEVESMKLQGEEVDDELHQELSKAHDEYVKVQEHLHNRSQQYKVLEEENRAQREHSKELSIQVEDFKKQFENMKNKYEDRDQRWKALKANYSEEEMKLTEIESRLENETIKQMEIEKEREKALALVDKEKELNNMLQKDLEDSKGKANVWEGEAIEIAEKLEGVEASIKSYFNKAHGLKEEIIKLNEKRVTSSDNAENIHDNLAEAVSNAVDEAAVSISGIENMVGSFDDPAAGFVI